jgi:hypothetical protein
MVEFEENYARLIDEEEVANRKIRAAVDPALPLDVRGAG